MPSSLKNTQFIAPESAASVETKAITGTDHLGRTNPDSSSSSSITYTVLNDVVAKHFNNKEAQLSGIFYTILNAIQTTAKSIPWNVYALQKDEKGDKLPNHPFGELIYRPNPKQSWSEFVTQYLGYLLSTGNVFIYAVRNENGLSKGKANQLWIMPKNTEVVAGANWMADVKGYRVPKLHGGYDTFKAEDVLHIKRFNLDDCDYGLSPIQAAALNLSAIDYGIKQRIKQYANGGPATVLFNKEQNVEETTLDQQDEFVARVNQPGKVSFSDTELGVVKIGADVLNMDILNAAQADQGMVADMLQYPSILLSGNKSSTYNNVSEANKALYNNCVIPLLYDLKDGLNHKFGKDYSDKAYLDLDLSGIEVLKPNLSELITAANSATFLTINEKRKMVGEKALKEPNANIVFVGAAQVPLAEAGALPEAPAYDEEDPAVEGE